MTIPITDLASELKARTGQSPTYSVLYKRVLDGALPAVRIGRQWHIREADLPIVERVFGLVPVAAEPATA